MALRMSISGPHRPPNLPFFCLLSISLDTLDPFRFEIMTRRLGHDAVLRTLDMALASPSLETKLNAVIIKGLNDHEAVDFVDLTKHKSMSVRFIEFMPFSGKLSALTCTTSLTKEV
jgi:molybdenum cofactor biosynthesis enzyme MoaA